MDRKAFYALLGAMLTTSLGVGLIVPLLPVYAQTLGASGFWIGLIFGANPLMRGLFTLVMGALADRRDKKSLMMAGLVGYAAAAVGFVYAQSPAQLFLARVAQGAFSAMVMPVARAYAGELAPKGREGITMGQFALAFTLGFAFGPLAGGALHDLYGLSAPFWGMVGMSLSACTFVWRFVPRRPASVRFARRGLDLRPLADRQVVGLISGRTFVELGRGIFSALMPLIGADMLGLTAAQTGFVVTLRSSTESAMQPLSGRAADRFNRRSICQLGFIIVPVALVLTPGVRSYAGLGACAVLLGMGAGIAVPAAAAIAVEKGRTFGMGAMMGVDSTAQALGMAIGSTLGGTLMQLYSIRVAFMAAASLALVGVTIFTVLMRGYVNGGATSPSRTLVRAADTVPETLAAAPPGGQGGGQA